MDFIGALASLLLFACLAYWWARSGVILAKSPSSAKAKLRAGLHGVIMLSLALLTPLPASARAEVTCQHVGAFTYCSDGTSYQRVGDFTYGSDGTTYQHVGDFTYGPNKTVNQRVGDFTYGPGRSTCQHVGDFSYGPNGSACQ